MTNFLHDAIILDMVVMMRVRLQVDENEKNEIPEIDKGMRNWEWKLSKIDSQKEWGDLPYRPVKVP